MLNRINLTLSALSNRLNLGTRSLVLNASVINGTAMRIRQVHHDVMRKFKAVFKVGGSVARRSVPPMIDPTGWDARLAWHPGWLAAASSGSSSRSRAHAALAAASATTPRLVRGCCQAIDEIRAARAASRRTAKRVAFATIAGS